MAMERYCLSMSEKDIDKFERGRADAGMSKSAYVRLLIAEHENRIPAFIKNKEIIEQMAEINTNLKGILLKEEIGEEDKLKIFERIAEIEKMIKEKL